MGMFDTIKYNGQYFQSKDLDCSMDTYYIEGGRLLESDGHTEDHSPATAWAKEHPGEELPENLQGFLGMMGCMKWIETGKKDMDYHGILNFYGTNPETSRGLEYDAKFTNGELVEIKECDNGDVLAECPDGGWKATGTLDKDAVGYGDTPTDALLALSAHEEAISASHIAASRAARDADPVMIEYDAKWEAYCALPPAERKNAEQPKPPPYSLTERRPHWDARGEIPPSIPNAKPKGFKPPTQRPAERTE